MYLCKFSTVGFRGFDKEITLNFDDCGGYGFNSHLLVNDVAKNAIIFGKNGSGKTNLCLGLADIVSVLSINDYNSLISDRAQYKCLNNDALEPISFKYVFKSDYGLITYSYSKSDFQTLISEELAINNKPILKCTFYPNRVADFEIFDDKYKKIKDAIGDFIGNRSSLIKYIIHSIISNQYPVLVELKEFADGVLWFRSLRANEYVGFKTGSDNLDEVIVSNNEFPMFQQFLKANDLDLKLSVKTINGKPRIFVNYKNGICPLTDVWSSGTQALTLIYTWIVLCKKKQPSLVIIDEFDAYYHFKAAESIYRWLADYNFQVVLTSHNTYLMKNSITRPDCVYLISNGKVANLPNCIENNKEIREAHNLEKIYRNGGFCE